PTPSTRSSLTAGRGFRIARATASSISPRSRPASAPEGLDTDRTDVLFFGMAVDYRAHPSATAMNRVSGMPLAGSRNPYMGCAHRCTFCYVRAFEQRADRPSDDR